SRRSLPWPSSRSRATIRTATTRASRPSAGSATSRRFACRGGRRQAGSTTASGAAAARSVHYGGAAPMRPSKRRPDEMRPVRFLADYARNAAGSVLVEFGDTRVLCTASVEAKVPPFLKGRQEGWVTAEYGMLPGATHTRTAREAA